MREKSENEGEMGDGQTENVLVGEMAAGATSRSAESEVVMEMVNVSGMEWLNVGQGMLQQMRSVEALKKTGQQMRLDGETEMNVEVNQNWTGVLRTREMTEIWEYHLTAGVPRHMKNEGSSRTRWSIDIE